ncbi:MAG: CsbD family protein [Actinobacteria bacterium]|nr:CsbD family protein [Actinomycetota bacterium]
MGVSENIEEGAGRMKEAAGSLLGDEELKEEGRAQQDKARAEQKAEQAEREAIEARKEAAAHETREERTETNGTRDHRP